MAAINGVSSYNYFDYNSWEKRATDQADQIKNSVTGTSSSTSTSSSSVSSASGFLMGYQTRLEDLESASAKLSLSSKDNVFQKYDDAVRAASLAGDSSAAASKVDSAFNDIVSSVKDLVDKVNSTMSYLKSNSGISSGVSAQLDSLKRSLPSEKTLKAMGISYNMDGSLKLDEEALKSALQKPDEDAIRQAIEKGDDEALKKALQNQGDPDQVRELIGGQFGLATRVGSKATSILDSSVNSIIGGSSSYSSSSSSSSTDKTNSTTASASTSTSASKNSYTSDTFKQFASFARSGAYNLSNYYAVSMLNILV